MHITVRMMFYISIIGFKYIICNQGEWDSSDIVALLAKKPMQLY